jgi:hypothetical protein
MVERTAKTDDARRDRVRRCVRTHDPSSPEEDDPPWQAPHVRRSIRPRGSEALLGKYGSSTSGSQSNDWQSDRHLEISVSTEETTRQVRHEVQLDEGSKAKRSKNHEENGGIEKKSNV